MDRGTLKKADLINLWFLRVFWVVYPSTPTADSGTCNIPKSMNPSHMMVIIGDLETQRPINSALRAQLLFAYSQHRVWPEFAWEGLTPSRILISQHVVDPLDTSDHMSDKEYSTQMSLKGPKIPTQRVLAPGSLGLFRNSASGAFERGEL